MYELFFITYPVTNKGKLRDLFDHTGFCRIFNAIKNSSNNSMFQGHYEFINTETYAELSQYDVVKKQRRIQKINETVGTNITDVLLGQKEAKYFYSFSKDVMDALTTVSVLETTISKNEAKWMQDDLQCMTKSRIGYAYAAINLCLGDPTPVKMGATMRDSPYYRLKELSSCLPQSFELLACVPSNDPFAVERVIHAHFDRFRIKKRSTGRNTEFFMVSKDMVCQYFAQLNQELLLPA